MDRSKRRGSKLSRGASTESSEDPLGLGKSAKERRKKPKERWLLTRKTWRYMADAGRRLIPEGVHNRPEDIPKIEAYFQEVCKKEPTFVLWRKNSYPGALGFRSHKKRKDRRKGGSCRKASSADEIEQLKPTRPKDLALVPTSGGRFDIQKMKYDFLNQPYSTGTTPESPFGKRTFGQPSEEELQEIQLLDMLEKCLSISSQKDEQRPSTSNPYPNLNYEELFNRLQEHLRTVAKNIPQHYVPPKREGVHFEGDHVQKSLAETLSRYFAQYPNRDKVISDLLTDRKALEKLYFELRRAKGFRSNRTSNYTSQVLPWAGDFYNNAGRGYGTTSRRLGRIGKDGTFVTPPPLIEIQGESVEPTYQEWGIQTDSIPEDQLVQLEDEFKKIVAEREEETREFKAPGSRRRSSVDNDDVSQSVSDTIKRYLRMARKKSADSGKHDRFKRVNYDRNLRNIKAKGEITKPGDDDGLNKGCQTNENWISTFRDCKFADPNTLSDPESRNISSRSSIDAGIAEETEVPPNTPQGFLSSSQTFFSNLLHGKHSHEKPSSSAGAMQKSKSSSSVMHQGGRLVAKKIFRSRSKSQTRAAQSQLKWTPQGGCVWNSVSGRQVVLGDTNLLELSEIERKVLQKVALAKLQALNLGVTVKVPTENIGVTPQKPKRRHYLLKKKAVTTGFFDANRKDGDKDKDSTSSGGLVFGIPLSQCVENDRLSRVSSLRNQELPGNEHNLGRHGSRSSFSSLIDASRDEENGSCESLMGKEKTMGSSVPGLLDRLSSGSTSDIIAATTSAKEPAIPNIITICMNHLERYGLQTLGIFRVSPLKARVRQLREDFDGGKDAQLDEVDPHAIATLLKEFLRDLPDPLLCRDLYGAFVQTQKIENRKLQLEALEHLIQLLPTANRDTLWALLNFLATVARNSEDRIGPGGSDLRGNKMDTSNLATVFAPNILHCAKPGGKDGQDKGEDRLDVISVVKTLIECNKQLFHVPAELLDEVYIYMMDSHPDALNQLLAKKSAATSGNEDSLDDLDSESTSAPLTPTALTSHMTIEHLVNPDLDGCQTPPERKKMWSREQFLHESTATGNRRVRPKERDSGKDKSRRRREESLTRKRRDEDGVVLPAAKSLISILRGQKDDDLQYQKLRSSSIDSGGSVHHDGGEDRRKSTPYVLDSSGVITASLKIPVHQAGSQPLALNVDRTDIPFIEDGGGFSYSADGRTRLSLSKTPEVPRRQRSISGSDSSVASVIQPVTGSFSFGQSYDSAIGSSVTVGSPPMNATPSSIGSSMGEAGSPPSWASTPPTSPDSLHVVNYIPEEAKLVKGQRGSLGTIVAKDAPTSSSQKVTFTAKPDVHKPIYQKEVSYQRRLTSADNLKSARDIRDKNCNPSISSIGNAVLRSRTADFERIAKEEQKAKATASEKKKYTKRRYTDSRHQTRHIPDSESLEVSRATSGTREDVSRGGASQTVYKRRELISSVPK